MPSECVKVVVRCRPLNASELQNNPKIIVTVEHSTNSILLSKPDNSDNCK